MTVQKKMIGRARCAYEDLPRCALRQGVSNSGNAGTNRSYLEVNTIQTEPKKRQRHASEATSNAMVSGSGLVARCFKCDSCTLIERARPECVD